VHLFPVIFAEPGGSPKRVFLEERPMSEPTRRISDDVAALSSDAYTRFIQENLRRVFLLIYRIVGNIDDAQDLTQETFIKALQNRSQLKELDKAAHWLSRIASNTAIDFLRRNRRAAYGDVAELTGPVAIAPGDSPEKTLLRSEHKTHLDGGLATLTERERTALVLRDVEDLPASEVARLMNCSMATVRSHIANARVKFKRYLETRKY
jgi:RNA polymerase sigma-70 factor, ECF subfamily